MSHDLILKKLEQMKVLLSELNQLLVLPFSEFKKVFTNIRSAERNFQLIVEIASDINAQFVKSSNLRNILIHEYDFDEDNFIFYNSAKEFIPLYDSYIESIKSYIKSK